MWDLLTVRSTSEAKLWRLWLDGLCPLLLHTASLSEIEDLRCCVLSTSACPSSLCNTSSSHLLTGRKCFPHYINDDSTHTIIRSVPSFGIHLLLRLCRWSCAGGWRDSNYVSPVGLTLLVVRRCHADI